jgi:hypothetical protein
MLQRYGVDHPVHEIHQIRQVLNHISFDSLVCWDLDNTLLQAKHELGSDQWFNAMISHVLKKMPSEPLAIQWALSVYTHIQHLTQVQPVEPVVIKMIRLMQEIGIPQYIVTARNNELVDTTLRQLQQVGLQFNKNNIIFCSGRNKAECLELFLDVLPRNPRHVVMVDDKASHVHDIKRLAQMKQMRFNGFSYRHLDHKVTHFDMGLANYQLSLIFDVLPHHIQEKIDHLMIMDDQPVSKIKQPFTFFMRGAEVSYGASDEIEESSLSSLSSSM